VFNAESYVLSATQQVRRELDELERVKAVLRCDALESARRAIGLDYIEEVQRSTRALGLDYAYQQYELQRQLLGEYPAWFDTLTALQNQKAHLASYRLPWFIRDSVDLEWLWAEKKVSSLVADHFERVRLQIAAWVLQPHEPARPPRQPGKQKFILNAELLRVKVQQLRTLYTRVQSMMTTLLRHFIFGTRFTASIEPAVGVSV
jgi:hypothetical protein